jgi:ParB family transcriptional regulator, chromosome partitioning protein
MSRKVLGRGLNALISNEIEASEGQGSLELDIDLIQPNPEQPRTRFTDSALAELSQSIKENGIVQPIVVRKKGNGYEIVAGERRWRASQMIGLLKIPAVVREVSDDKLLELALIENIQRQELNAIEEAKAYKRLIETIGLTQEMVAQRVGKERTVITNHLRLLKLPGEVQIFVEEGKMSAGHARAVLAAGDEASQKRLARAIIDSSMSVREAEKQAKKYARGETNGAEAVKVKKSLDPNIKAAEVRMRRDLGTQVRVIPDGKGTGGKIEIEYYSDSDLDRIYQLVVAKQG